MTQGRRTAEYVSAAHSMLGIAMVLAGARIGEALGWWRVDRLGTIAAHFHLAAFGFAGLTAVGVGSRMLPMLMVSGPSPERPLRLIGPAGSAGLLLLAAGLVFRLAPLVWAGAVLGLGAAALFVALIGRFFARRMVRRLEPAFGHVAAGFAFLLLALTAGVWQLATPGFTARGWAVYGVLTVLGWLVVFITGVLYRLFPFLIWLHFYARLGSARVAAELVNRRLAWAALASLVAGLLMLAGGIAAGDAVVARAGAAAYLAGSVLVAVQYPLIWRGRPAAASPAAA
jgi:hypothetical protein